jgi:hypothetical protein
MTKYPNVGNRVAATELAPETHTRGCPKSFSERSAKSDWGDRDQPARCACHLPLYAWNSEVHNAAPTSNRPSQMKKKLARDA